MRRLRYGAAATLDGFIAGPNGEFDWIVHDPAIDLAAIFAQFDTLPGTSFTVPFAEIAALAQ